MPTARGSERHPHAGTPDLQAATRKFGIIWETYSNTPFSTKPLTDRLASCGVSSPTVIQVDVSGNEASGYTSNAGSVVARMRSDGVTSIFCLSAVFLAARAVGEAADAQRLLP